MGGDGGGGQGVVSLPGGGSRVDSPVRALKEQQLQPRRSA